MMTSISTTLYLYNHQIAYRYYYYYYYIMLQTNIWGNYGEKAFSFLGSNANVHHPWYQQSWNWHYHYLVNIFHEQI